MFGKISEHRSFSINGEGGSTMAFVQTKHRPNRPFTLSSRHPRSSCYKISFYSLHAELHLDPIMFRVTCVMQASSIFIANRFP